VLHNPIKRATPTRDIVPWSLKLVTMYTFEISPMKGVRCFWIKGKLAPRYIGMYPILEKYGPLAYRVKLSSRLSSVHNVFHMSQLKRCMKPLADVVNEDNIPLEANLTYKCYPIKVLDQQDRAT
jgi:hypothetical protein